MSSWPGRQGTQQRVAAVGGLAAIALLSGCSVVLSTDGTQCTVDADCGARGFVNAVCEQNLCVEGTVLPEKWQCLGTIEEPVPTPGEMHLYRVQIIEFVTQQPPPGLSVLVCSILDLNCDQPLSGPHLPDANGFIETQVPSGFDGFFDIVSDTTMPALLFPPLPIVADELNVDSVQIVTPALFDVVANTAGFPPDPARGHALVLSSDCNNAPSAGSTISIDDGDDATKVFYLIDSQPDIDAPATDASGNGGFLNIPEGFVTIRGQLAEEGVPIGEARFQSRPGKISYVNIRPTPL